MSDHLSPAEQAIAQLAANNQDTIDSVLAEPARFVEIVSILYDTPEARDGAFKQLSPEDPALGPVAHMLHDANLCQAVENLVKASPNAETVVTFARLFDDAQRQDTLMPSDSSLPIFAAITSQFVGYAIQEDKVPLWSQVSCLVQDVTVTNNESERPIPLGMLLRPFILYHIHADSESRKALETLGMIIDDDHPQHQKALELLSTPQGLLQTIAAASNNESAAFSYPVFSYLGKSVIEIVQEHLTPQQAAAFTQKLDNGVDTNGLTPQYGATGGFVAGMWWRTLVENYDDLNNAINSKLQKLSNQGQIQLFDDNGNTTLDVRRMFSGMFLYALQEYGAVIQRKLEQHDRAQLN